MILSFPRDLVLEVYLGRWVDVTALPKNQNLRQVEPVTISRGLPSEQSKSLAPPQTLGFSLNNAGGVWTPGNAMSAYYRYLQGRNAPTRLSLRVQRDRFTGRTVSNGFGTAESGDLYDRITGPTSDYAVAAGVGTMSIGIAGTQRLMCNATSYVDGEVRGTCTIPINNVTGGPVSAGLVARYQVGFGTFYLLAAYVSAAEVLTLQIEHSSGAVLAGPVTVAGLVDAVSSKTLRLAFLVEGQTFRGKVYKPGAAGDPDQFEPLDWQITLHDEQIETVGEFGWDYTVIGTNTNTMPVVASWDDLEVRLPRFAGELQKSAPGWDTSSRVKTAAVTAAGISMRLGQARRAPLSSTTRRYLGAGIAATPAVWWPLDEPSTAIYGEAAGGAGRVTISNTDLTQSDHWGRGDMGPAIGKCLLVDWHVDHVGAWVPFQVLGAITPTTTTSWAWDVTVQFGSKTRMRVDFEPGFLPANVGWFVLQMTPTAGGSLVGFNDAGGTAVGFSMPAGVWDGQPHHLRLEIAQSGGNAPFTLYVDGVSTVSGPGTGSTVLPFSRYLINSPSATNSPFALANIALWFGGNQPSVSGTASAVRGWIGEKAGLRAFRLCTEEGIPFDYRGDLSLTPPMGPQRAIPLIDQVVECADAAGALLYEPRSVPGLALRTRQSMSARDPDATLSYATGHIFPPFNPSADDRPSANLVRAERLEGGFVIVEQTTGPMNTQDPGTDPDAIGVSPADARVNVEGDVLLPNVGGWVRALGTVPDVRYPRATVNLRATAFRDPLTYLLAASVLALNVGDRLLVTGLQEVDLYRDLDQVVAGLTETYSGTREEHLVTFNTAPYEKYRTAVYGDSTSRYDSGGVTTFDSSLTTTTTGARNVTVVSGSRWTINAAVYPLDVDCEGERITLSGVTGAGAAQVMTISARSVNGVVKAHAAGAVVRLWQSTYYE